jgi:hypothetical protein
MNTEQKEPETGLRYFTHPFENANYGGWYRPLGDDAIEVLAVGLIRTVRLGGRNPEIAACEALDEFVRLRKSYGLPLPSADTWAEDPTAVCAHLDRDRGGTA